VDRDSRKRWLEKIFQGSLSRVRKFGGGAGGGGGEKKELLKSE